MDLGSGDPTTQIGRERTATRSGGDVAPLPLRWSLGSPSCGRTPYTTSTPDSIFSSGRGRVSAARTPSRLERVDPASPWPKCNRSERVTAVPAGADPRREVRFDRPATTMTTGEASARASRSRCPATSWSVSPPSRADARRDGDYTRRPNVLRRGSSPSNLAPATASTNTMRVVRTPTARVATRFCSICASRRRCDRRTTSTARTSLRS